MNPESGTVTVRATSRQHEKVAEFLEQVIGSAKRQVLIEATIVEVELNDQYQSGVDWSALAINGLGYSFTQSLIGANFADAAGSSRSPTAIRTRPSAATSRAPSSCSASSARRGCCRARCSWSSTTRPPC